LLKERVEFEERPGSDHQILVNASNKLLQAERKNNEVRLTKREISVLTKYSK
jgi:hypothetical protein